jgi:NAD(P)H-hydrate epimerase
VDIPSGVATDTGRVEGAAIRAHTTVTFGLPKPGLLIYPGAEYTGKLVVASIGYPLDLLESPDLTVHWLTRTEIKSILPQRQVTAHKGSTGQVLLIGGTQGMTGAVALAGNSALRSGCGLVTIGHRPGLDFTEKPLEVMTIGWPELAKKDLHYRCVVVGPGLGLEPDGSLFMAELFDRLPDLPFIIDADGLNLLAADPGLREKLPCNTVFTPHPGEFSRLSGLSVAEIQEDRINISRRFSKDWGVVLILKGARTIIAAPDGRVYINSTGNPGMATAGMGDVLAGMVGGLVAQGLNVTMAAIAGTYLHGLAGDLAAESMGGAGIIASDLLPMIPRARKKVAGDE